MSLRRLAVAGLLAFALAGCQSSKVGRSYSLERQPDHAVILLGLRGDPPSTHVYTRLILGFQPYDRQTDTLAAGRRFNIVAERCRGGCNDFKTMRYFILHVPAGDYVLKTITAENDNSFPKTRKTTALVGLTLGKNLFGTTTGSVPTRGGLGRGLRYHFGAGEVAYLGDFIIDAVAFPASIREIIRNDALVERARRGYPGLTTASWVFRPPNDAEGKTMLVQNSGGAAATDPTDNIVPDLVPAGDNPAEGGVQLQDQ